MTPTRILTSTPQLIYLVFGATTYHQEAVFSIVSALAGLRQTPGQALDIQVFSDDPLPYQQLPVQVHSLSAEILQAWSGPHAYHFRSKHEVLRQVLQDCERALLIDTDTFFQCSPLKLFERIKPGTLLCNVRNQRFGLYRETHLYQMLAPSLEQRGMADDDMPLINSGVIGLMREDAGVLDQSLALMDEFYPQVKGAYTFEEFCLGVAAYRSKQIDQCPDLIHHYWSRKQLFRAKVSAWLGKHGHAPLSEAALDDTHHVTSQLPRPPSWQRQLYKVLTLGVPAQQRQFLRELLYGCYTHSNEFDQACTRVWWDKALENVEQRLQQPLDALQLERWLNHWLVRRMLGEQRQMIYEHLSQRDQSN